jgi:hypothetical protein
MRNHLPLNTPFNDIKFGEGLIDFGSVEDGRISRSTLDMGGGYILNLTGEVVHTHQTGDMIKWRGVGIADTRTAGWIYDYQAFVSPTWPEQTDKTPVLLGQTLRTVAHGQAPAGVTGTFFMVKNNEQ